MRLIATLAVVLLCSIPLHAGQYSSRSIPAVRTPLPPVIDGRLDDEVWRTAPVARDFVDPYTGKPAVEQTEAYILYDSTAIYVAFYCHDSQPEAIVAREIRPGSEFPGEDTVTFQIDPFFSRNWTGISAFIVNALGTQNERIAGGRAAKREWRGIWQAAVQRVPDGWTVEMRIPWEVLNYPSVHGAVNMSINFKRDHARTRIDYFWSDVTPLRRPELMGIWQGVQPPKATQRNTLQMLTYLTPEWQDGGKQEVRAGVDLRYAPTPQLTGVLSLSPDFRNIEGAVEGIEFSRSERFVEETRPFFMEGIRYFDLTEPYGIGRLFYARRIRQFDAGVKLFGNLNSALSVGVLSTFYGKRESASVAHLRYSLGERGGWSVFGLLRRGNENPHHDGYGITGNYRLGNYRLGGKWIYAREASTGGVAADVTLNYEVPRWFSGLRWMRIDPDFRAALGLVSFTDRQGWSWYTRYDNEIRQGPIREVEADFFWRHYTHCDGSPFEEGTNASVELTFRSDYSLRLGYEIATFEGARDRVYEIGVQGNVSNRFQRWELSYEFGQRSDQDIRFVRFGLTRRLLGRLDVGFSGSILRFDQSREQYILTFSWEFDPLRALSARLVRRDNDLNWYVAYRSAGGVGQDLYLIVGDPNSRRFTERVALKWVWAR
ncbi:MAG: carbohydrate binding family 9 domain-containing protein [Armatimonadota bacterium]|nr:carbohydrate binding family 9 domain-containing protein [Armatimonadota bacterium]